MNLDWITQPCPQPDEQARVKAEARQATLTKPPGSLGRLEQIAILFAAWQAKEIASLTQVKVRVFAADHGICAQGVSAFPQAVTAQMIENFIDGGAAISVLSSSLGADFAVVNLGTANPLNRVAPNLINTPIAEGTTDFSITSAMTQQQLAMALEAGRESATDCELFVGGEMGIGNTSSAAAIYAAVLNLSGTDTVGPGTGLDSSGVTHKAKVIDRALALHQDKLNNGLSILQCLGGFEVAALTGAYIAAAQRRIPVLVDGYICTAAALLASEINPESRPWMMFAHQSAEPAHIKALQALKATPLLSLEMRLGEGSGAAFAVPLIQQALTLHANMATFVDAGVSEQNA